MQVISLNQVKSLYTLTFTFLLFLFSFSQISSQITFTNGAGDNLWETPGNWSTGMVPNFEDVIIPVGMVVEIATYAEVINLENHGEIHGELVIESDLINHGEIYTDFAYYTGNIENYNLITFNEGSFDSNLLNEGQIIASSFFTVQGESENNGTIETGDHTIFMDTHVNNSIITVSNSLLEFQQGMTNNGTITTEDLLVDAATIINAGNIFTGYLGNNFSTITNNGNFTTENGAYISEGDFQNNNLFHNLGGIIEYENGAFINNSCALFIQESNQTSSITNHGLVQDLTNNIIEDGNSSGGIVLTGADIAGTSLTISSSGNDMYSIDGGSSFQSSNVFDNLNTSFVEIVLTNATNNCSPPVILLTLPTLIPCDDKPVAVATGELNTCNLEFSYNANNSVDNSGAANLMYAWDFGTGSFSFSSMGTYTFDECGVEEVILIITDPDVDDIFCNSDTLTFQLEYDTEVPQITCPPYSEIFCTENTPIFFDIFSFEAAGGQVIDNCDMLDFGLISSEVVDGTCPAFEVILNTYMVTDACGNSAECTQEIGRVTDGGPSLIFCPADVTLGCGADTSIDALGSAIFDQDGCEFEIIIEDDLPVDPICNEVYTFTRTFTAVDDCNGNASCQQIISVNPPEAPVITSTPPDLTITFGDPLPPIADIPYENGSSSCNLSGNVVFNQIVGGPEECGNMFFYHWTEEVCGTILDYMQYITVLPIEEEYEYICPSDIVVPIDDTETEAVVTYVVDAIPYCDNPAATIIQTDNSGLTSGDAFPVGITTQTYEIISDNETFICEFIIEVIQGDPDLTCTFSFIPGVANGTTLMATSVSVRELNDIPSTGLITVVIPKDPSLSFSFNSSATFIGPYAVDNASWTYDSSNPAFHVFTTDESIPAGETLSLGYVASFAPGNSNGQVTYTATVVANSGGESNFYNNIDAETLVFFNN